MNRPEKQSGFTLMELSVSLVVIGLISGGILAGTSLYHAAELNTIMTEARAYAVALHDFRTQYNSLPGDFNSAVNFWGQADADQTTCESMDKTLMTKTCNGNGDGQITDGTAEQYLAWHHLRNAGLIKGQFTGAVITTNFYKHVPGLNCPSSNFRQGSGWGIRYKEAENDPDANFFMGNYGTILAYGKEYKTAMPTSAALTPAELYKIDTKYDDGKPALGDIVARNSTHHPSKYCTQLNGGDTDADDYNAEYNLDYPKLACSFFYRNILE